jgi:hypothetical protein
VSDIDLSRLSDSDLQALKSGDMTKVSDEGLRVLSGQTRSTYSFGDALLQGASMGFSDELGAMRDVGNYPGTTYEANMQDRKVAREKYTRDNPAYSYGGELLGALGSSMVPFVGGYNVARLPAVASRFSPAAAKYLGLSSTGASAGAITGAGTADPGEAGPGAARGAVTGALLGPVLGAATGVVRGTGQVASDVLGTVPVVGPVVRTVTRSVPGVTADYATRAREKLLQAFQRDRLTPEDVQQRVTQARALGDKPEVLADFGGRNTAGLADVTTKYPGIAKDMARDVLDDRVEGALSRVTGDLTKAFKVSGDPKVIAKGLAEKRKVDSDPLYAQAYQEGAVISNPEINQLMRLPAFQRAYGKARNLAAYDGVQLPKDLRKIDVWDLKTLNYVKFGLDDVLFTDARNLTSSKMGDAELRKVNDARVRFLEVLDFEAPTYAAARKAWAGPTVLKIALEDGQQFATKPLSELRERIAGMSDSELEQFKIGMLSGMRQNIDKVKDGRDLVKVVFGSPEKRQILRELVGPEFATLEQQFMREKSMRRTSDLVRGNSMTAERQAGMDDLGANVDTLRAVVNEGPVRGSFNYMLRSATGVAQPTADKLGPMLFSTDRAAMDNLLREIARLDQQKRAWAGGRAAMGGVAGGSLVTGNYGTENLPSLLGGRQQ